MGKYKQNKGKITVNPEGKSIHLFSEKYVNDFNPSILNLGKIDTPSTMIDSLVVLYDLCDFTHFCQQIDPDLVVPGFLNKFLQFLFDRIKEGAIIEKADSGYDLYHPLPYFVKFMGDGAIVLWETTGMPEFYIGQLIRSTKIICGEYITDFLPNISKKYSRTPPSLRAAIARGKVYSVGNKEDFVGPCINVASRLQKIRSASVIISARGIDFDDDEDLLEDFSLKRMTIRGIGDDELVYILNYEYENFDDEYKNLLLDP